MSRGKRRRRGRSRRGPKQPERTAAASSQGAPSGARRGRRRRGGRTAPTALERMARPKRLETLPPDGVLLEDVVAAMQGEYGTPSTPQEYRLMIKVPEVDETAEKPAPPPARSAEDSGRRARLRFRRRRRGRGSREAPGG